MVLFAVFLCLLYQGAKACDFALKAAYVRTNIQVTGVQVAAVQVAAVQHTAGRCAGAWKMAPENGPEGCRYFISLSSRSIARFWSLSARVRFLS